MADEIIVTDTGSTDRTVALAQEAGAKVTHFPWCDDFSAARNAALDEATGDWILWLDSDEEVLPSRHDEIHQSIRSPDALMYYVLRQDLSTPDPHGPYTQMWQLRLFRNRPELRFIGRCHPHFDPPEHALADREKLKILTSTITLRHYGYVAERMPAKLRRTVRLLEMELQDRPGQLYYLIELARTLQALEDDRAHEATLQATRALVPHLEDERAPLPLVATLFEALLQLPEDVLPSPFDRERLVDLAMRWFPDAPPLLWILARQAYESQEFVTAEKLLRRLIDLGRSHRYDLSTSFAPHIVGSGARLNLGDCLIRQARLAEAERVITPLIQDPDYGKQARANLATIKRLKRESKPSRKQRPKKTRPKRRR